MTSRASSRRSAKDGEVFRHSPGLEKTIDTTEIHSNRGLLDSAHSFVATRPFQSPHHTISDIGLIGGGVNSTSGEISVAHNGVLFLDEKPQFHRSTLEVLRQLMEDGWRLE
jgi:magnesium chelatase family protein